MNSALLFLCLFSTLAFLLFIYRVWKRPSLSNQKQLLADRPRPLLHWFEWRCGSTCSLCLLSVGPVCTWFTCSDAPEDPLKFNTVRWREIRKWSRWIYRCVLLSELVFDVCSVGRSGSVLFQSRWVSVSVLYI